MKILNDTEHRIFLSAMSREKKICKEIDADKVNDGTVTMLLPICKSIERKVNNAVSMENIDKMIAEFDMYKKNSDKVSIDSVIKVISRYCKGVDHD